MIQRTNNTASRHWTIHSCAATFGSSSCCCAPGSPAASVEAIAEKQDAREHRSSSSTNLQLQRLQQPAGACASRLPLRPPSPPPFQPATEPCRPPASGRERDRGIRSQPFVAVRAAQCAIAAAPTPIHLLLALAVFQPVQPAASVAVLPVLLAPNLLEVACADTDRDAVAEERVDLAHRRSVHQSPDVDQPILAICQARTQPKNANSGRKQTCELGFDTESAFATARRKAQHHTSASTRAHF